VIIGIARIPYTTANWKDQPEPYIKSEPTYNFPPLTLAPTPYHDPLRNNEPSGSARMDNDNDNGKDKDKDKDKDTARKYKGTARKDKGTARKGKGTARKNKGPARKGKDWDDKGWRPSGHR
jgi:hypothetical protein